MSIRIKRAYDKPGTDDGCRILVDRIWPRGVSREELEIEYWMKEVAPSDELRTWFGHDPKKFEAFRERYHKELEHEEKTEQVERLLELARQQDLTLVYGAKDRQHNQALVLKEYLEELL